MSVYGYVNQETVVSASFDSVSGDAFRMQRASIYFRLTNVDILEHRQKACTKIPHLFRRTTARSEVCVLFCDLLQNDIYLYCNLRNTQVISDNEIDHLLKTNKQ